MIESLTVITVIISYRFGCTNDALREAADNGYRGFDPYDPKIHGPRKDLPEPVATLVRHRDWQKWPVTLVKIKWKPIRLS